MARANTGSKAEADQVQAAARDAYVGMASVRPTGPRTIGWDERPQWFRDLVRDGAAAKDRMLVCAHLQDTGPAPCVVFAEQPGRMRCRECAEREWPTRRCLDCGRTAAADGKETIIQVSMMLASMVQCPLCYQRASGPPATFQRRSAS